MHAGATAAYLARDGDVIALSGDDVFDERQMPLLVRALGAAPALDITISSTQLAEGDAIVLLGRRVRGAEDRRALLGYVEANDPGEHVLVARFEHDDAAQRDAPRPPGLRSLCVTALTRVAAAIAFLIAAVSAH
jgi:hypothetical protein